jgi:hypothetical protein
MNTRVERKGGVWVPGDRVDAVKAQNANINMAWQAAVDELNARFRHAECRLHYHNGFIQIETDEMIAAG